MTHIKAGGLQTTPPPATPALEPTRAAAGAAHRQSLDRHELSSGIAARRQRLHELEIEMVAACEAAAAGSAPREVVVADRGTWDRKMWDRYLAAAAKLECDYGPEMRRLLQQIDQLERLLKLQVSAQSYRVPTE
jgi:hypothetical protein